MGERVFTDPQTGEVVLNPQTNEPFVFTFPDDAPREQVFTEAQNAFEQIKQARPDVAESFLELTDPTSQAQVPTPGELAGVTGRTAATAGQVVGEIAKEEALPLAATAAVGAAFPPAGAALGAARVARNPAVRAAAVGTAGVLARKATATLRGQPQPGFGELVFEFGMSVVPELPAAALLEASEKTSVGNAFAKRFVRPGVDEALVGQAMKREGTSLMRIVRRQRDQKFARGTATASRLKLATVPGGDARLTSQKVLSALEQPAQIPTGVVDRAGQPITRSGTTPIEGLSQDGQRVREIARRLQQSASSGKPIPFRELSDMRITLSDIGDEQVSELAFSLSRSIKDDMTRLAAGTQAEAPLRAADDFMKDEFVSVRETVARIDADSLAPEDVVTLLAKKPSRLKEVFKRLDPAIKQDIQSAFWAKQLQKASERGVVDPKLLRRQLKAIDPKTRKLMTGEGARDLDKINDRLIEITDREAFLERFRFAQNGALAVTGIALATALNNGDVGGAFVPILGTIGGVQLFARMISIPGSRRLLARGLANEKTAPRLAGRLILQAMERAGVAGIEEALTGGVSERAGAAPQPPGLPFANIGLPQSQPVTAVSGVRG